MNRKTFLSFTLSALLAGAACGAQAEDGTITFTGAIEDGTCAIAPDSQAIDVDFGSINTQVNGSNKIVKKQFNINLTDCPSSVSSAIVAWAGESSGPANTNLMTYVDGVAVTDSTVVWKIAAGVDNTNNAFSNSVSFDGTPESAKSITSGDNTLNYTAALSSAYFTLPAGELTGDATYSVTYN